MTIEDPRPMLRSTLEPMITFSHEDVAGIFLCEDETMVISMKLDVWKVKQVLVDPMS